MHAMCLYLNSNIPIEVKKSRCKAPSRGTERGGDRTGEILIHRTRVWGQLCCF